MCSPTCASSSFYFLLLSFSVVFPASAQTSSDPEADPSAVTVSIDRHRSIDTGADSNFGFVTMLADLEDRGFDHLPPYNGPVSSIDPRLAQLVARAQYPGLRVLVLFGSRARGDAGAFADWDVGYLADSGFDPDRLLADAVRILGSDQIDLVDLARAGGQLRYRAARDGRLVFEARRGEFASFWMEAVTFWCDAAPVLGRAYAGVLERLRR